tara:strand:- start:404 stop:697 length:294 start_codon:yes stop_codon:yes gene_type:complete
MKLTEDNLMDLGSVQVHTTNNKGHDPEFWAEQATNRICGISENAAPHIKQQAEAFKKNIYVIILSNIKSALRSHRLTMSHKLKQQGHEDLAKIMKEL